MRVMVVSLVTRNGKPADAGIIENLRGFARRADAPLREIKDRGPDANPHTIILTDPQNPTQVGTIENFVRYAQMHEFDVQKFANDPTAAP